jgi:hypothetical protein
MILAKQLDKQGMAIVYIEQLSYDNNLKPKSKRISTGVKVKPLQWSKSKQEVLKSDGEYENKNQIINSVYLANLSPIETTKSINGIVDYLTEYIEHRKANGTGYTTYKEYTTLKSRLTEYEKHLGRKLFFVNLNYSFSDSFNIWMVNTKEYGSGTIDKTYILLRTFCSHFYKRRSELNIEMNDIFLQKEFKHGKPARNEPHPMNEKDYFLIVNAKNLNQSEQKTRDRIIFQICTGLRYGDAFTVKPNMIVGNCIKISPSKTRNKPNNIVFININRVSGEILNRYDNDTTKLKVSNQKYNDSIETLCTKLKLSCKYTSHDFRDTFIQNAVNQEISIPVILSWTGQESYEVMKRYFKVNEEQKAADMHKIAIYQHPEELDPNFKMSDNIDWLDFSELDE